MEISVASDIALYQAMQRRSLALDLTNLVSYEVMRSWTDRLFALYSQPPAPGFQKISQTQLLRADRQAFVRLGELHTGPVKPGPGPGKLLDHFVGRLEHDVSVTYFMLPLPVHSTTTGDKSDKGDKGDKGDKAPKRPPGGGADADPNPKRKKKGGGKGKRDPVPPSRACILVHRRMNRSVLHTTSILVRKAAVVQGSIVAQFRAAINRTFNRNTNENGILPKMWH